MPQRRGRRVIHPGMGGGPMARNHTRRHHAGANDGENDDLPALAADVLPRIWSSWMQSGFDTAEQWAKLFQPWWQPPHLGAGDLPSHGAKQLTGHHPDDPLLKSIEQVWNANPLHEVIPLDWAGIAWALRTVWFRSFTRPDMLPAFLELNAAIWRSTLDIWSKAGLCWCGHISSNPAEAAKSGDKRFGAPEWYGNPLYRMLMEAYLLASDWLLKHSEVPDMGDAEQLRFNFHLRQFVDAMSPALQLALNPVALRRAFETHQSSRIPASCAREETPESRGMPCLFLNTERGFGGKPPQKSRFRRHLAGSKMPKEGSKMPKETMPRVFSTGSRRQPAALVSDQPIPASTGIWCRQEMAYSGKPCRQSANLTPVPCSSTSKRSPSAATNLVCISGIQHIDLIRQYRGAGIDLLINGDRNDVETRVLFASDVMPHFAWRQMPKDRRRRRSCRSEVRMGREEEPGLLT